jgi:mannose-6-phosphate isomerase-like protein (cupin superfamily)
MDAWELAEVEAVQAASGARYHEFLTVPHLSAGLYVLDPGDEDTQSPHTEDEIYVVMSGRAQMTVEDDDRPVGPGSLIFVAAGVPHRFHDVTERLVLVVAFGPAEGSRAARAG